MILMRREYWQRPRRRVPPERGQLAMPKEFLAPACAASPDNAAPHPPEVKRPDPPAKAAPLRVESCLNYRPGPRERVQQRRPSGALEGGRVVGLTAHSQLVRVRMRVPLRRAEPEREQVRRAEPEQGAPPGLAFRHFVQLLHCVVARRVVGAAMPQPPPAPPLILHRYISSVGDPPPGRRQVLPACWQPRGTFLRPW